MRYLLILIFMFMMVSCIYNHTDNVEVLGNKFYFLGDGHESQILYDSKETPDYKTGITVVPPEVIEYDFDKKYIIAKTIKSVDGTRIYGYWIIDKKQNINSVSALDSESFYNKIDSLDLKINLSKRK